MGTHPLNLAIRFLLELAALGAAGMWGWKNGEGWVRYALAIGIPLSMAVMWGTFAVPDDPSRSGNAPVVTPGIVRLILELTYFGFASWTLLNMGYPKTGLAFAILVVLHYAASWDRIGWLIAH